MSRRPKRSDGSGRPPTEVERLTAKKQNKPRKERETLDVQRGARLFAPSLCPLMRPPRNRGIAGIPPWGGNCQFMHRGLSHPTSTPAPKPRRLPTLTIGLRSNPIAGDDIRPARFVCLGRASRLSHGGSSPKRAYLGTIGCLAIITYIRTSYLLASALASFVVAFTHRPGRRSNKGIFV